MSDILSDDDLTSLGRWRDTHEDALRYPRLTSTDVRALEFYLYLVAANRIAPPQPVSTETALLCAAITDYITYTVHWLSPPSRSLQPPSRPMPLRSPHGVPGATARRVRDSTSGSPGQR